MSLATHAAACGRNLRKLCAEHGIPNSFAFSELSDRPMSAGRAVRAHWEAFVTAAGVDGDIRIADDGRVTVEPKEEDDDGVNESLALLGFEPRGQR